MNTGLRVMVFQKYLQNCGGIQFNKSFWEMESNCLLHLLIFRYID